MNKPNIKLGILKTIITGCIKVNTLMKSPVIPNNKKTIGYLAKLLIGCRTLPEPI